MKALSLCLFLFLTYTALGQSYDVDSAQGLLNQLHSEAVVSLEDLNTQWEENSQILRANVASWEESEAADASECLDKGNDVEAARNDLEENHRFIEWISDKINETSTRYNSIYTDRCEQNRNYIKGLANDKITLGLIKFLRAAINDYEGGSFLQRKEIIGKIFTFVQLYQKKDFKALIQMKSQLESKLKQDDQGLVDDGEYAVETNTTVQQRTDEQIGEGHIDRGGDNITLQSYDSSQRRPWSEYKVEILALLDDLNTTVTEKMAQGAEDEMAAGLNAADFRGQLEHELQELDAELYNQIVLTGTLERRISELGALSEQCDAQLNRTRIALNNARSEYEEAEATYEEQRAGKQEEVETFLYVKQMYAQSIHQQGYQEQVQDYTEDGSYEGTYDDRQVDDIEYLNEENERANEEDGEAGQQDLEGF